MHGRDIVGLGREGFLAIAPPFTGDILWEHLEILQKGKSVFAICWEENAIFFDSKFAKFHYDTTTNERHELDDFSSLYFLLNGKMWWHLKSVEKLKGL